MNYVGHLFVAFLLFLVVVFFLPGFAGRDLVSMAVFLFVVLGSSLVPDLDHPKSKGTSILNKLIFIYIIFLTANWFFNINGTIIFALERLLWFAISTVVLYLAWIGFSKVVRPKHRGITHSFLLLVVYSGFIYFLFGFNLSIAALLGYFSHLVADMEFKLF